MRQCILVSEAVFNGNIKCFFNIISLKNSFVYFKTVCFVASASIILISSSPLLYLGAVFISSWYDGAFKKDCNFCNFCVVQN